MAKIKMHVNEINWNTHVAKTRFGRGNSNN